MKFSWTVKELIAELKKLGKDYENWEVISKNGTCFECLEFDEKHQIVKLSNKSKYSRYDR